MFTNERRFVKVLWSNRAIELQQPLSKVAPAYVAPVLVVQRSETALRGVRCTSGNVAPTVEVIAIIEVARHRDNARY